MDKMSQKYRFIQINLHHSKDAITLLCQILHTGETRYGTYLGMLGLRGMKKEIMQSNEDNVFC
jgi:hypothetical protein